MSPAQTQTNYACVLTAARAVDIQNIPVPSVGPDEVLVKVEATGICGSDVRWTAQAPTHYAKIVEHSFTSTITSALESFVFLNRVYSDMNPRELLSKLARKSQTGPLEIEFASNRQCFAESTFSFLLLLLLHAY